MSKRMMESIFFTTILGIVDFVFSLFFGKFTGSVGVSFGLIIVNSVLSIPVGIVLFFEHHIGRDPSSEWGMPQNKPHQYPNKFGCWLRLTDLCEAARAPLSFEDNSH